MPDNDYKRSITPAPVPPTQPATIQDTATMIGEHAAWCNEARRRECALRDKELAATREHDLSSAAVSREDMWRTIIAGKASLRTIKWMIGLAISLVALSVPATVLLIRYAVVGMVVVEVDKRMPPGVHINLREIEQMPRPAQIAEYSEP